MKGIQLIKPLVLFGLIWMTELRASCPYKECFCETSEIYCQEIGLASIPTPTSLDNFGFTNLILDMNKITTVSTRCFPYNLTLISFSLNPITIIDDAAFDGSISTLQSLSFSGSPFTRIPDALLRLHALESLNIQDMIIQDWNIKAMRNIGQTIKILDLRNVGLRTWPEWLKNFTKVTAITIVSSSISSIPDDALDLMVNSLKGLTVRNCSLTSVPKAVSKLTALISLDFQLNKIVDVRFIPQLSKISSLYLQYNKISDAVQLSQALRPLNGSLQLMELLNNALTAIPDLSFLSGISELDFRNNLISDPSSGDIPSGLFELDLGHNSLASVPSAWTRHISVTALNLPYNSVTKIQGTDFHSSTFEIDLEYNLITELTDGSFPQNASIRSVYLNNNPIMRISANAFRNLDKLMTLGIRGTRISRLPLDFVSLTSLRSLDMSGSVYLVCTCAEKTLTAWVRSIDQVTGDCGLISIYDFFTNLSSDCPDR